MSAIRFQVGRSLCSRATGSYHTRTRLENGRCFCYLNFTVKRKRTRVHVVELDSEFHKVLYEASNSRILQHMLTDFHNYVRKARKTSVEKKDRAEKSV